MNVGRLKHNKVMLQKVLTFQQPAWSTYVIILMI